MKAQGVGRTLNLAARTACCVAMLVVQTRAEKSRDASGRPAIGGILYNEDDSHRFMLAPAGKIKPEQLDKLVDDLANTEVTVMLICCNAKKTAYDSKAWTPQCVGFDPKRGNDQPYFGNLSADARIAVRKWAHNQLLLFQAGVDPMGRMIDRCRQRNISPWISMRMNDVHDAPDLTSPLHSTFWREHPEYWRFPKRFRTWTDRCLDYGQKPVRDHAMSLIEELCQRYDMDGLELDWNRFPGYLREGQEAEKAPVLTDWIGQVRNVVRSAEKKRGHPIVLAARVPARPEVAEAMGLDAVTWAKRGLIDHLIVAPFWATTDFDIPVDRWRELLAGSGVGVTAGLEIRVQPYPGSKTIENTIERRRGAAMAALARGSQGIYLFNYFDVAGSMPNLLKEMHAIETLRGKDRSHVVTYVDINAPRKRIPPALPKTLGPEASAEFRIFIGPKPIGAHGEVDLTLNTKDKTNEPRVRVTVNGKPTRETDAKGRYSFDGNAFLEGYNVVAIVNKAKTDVSVQHVELTVRFEK